MVTEARRSLTWDFVKLYLQTFVIIGLGAFTYTALFAAMGTFFRKPVLPAILFAFGWENLVSSIPARVQELSLRFHLRNLVDAARVGAAGPARPARRPAVDGASSASRCRSCSRSAVLVAVMLLSTVLGIWLLRQKEIAK